MKFFMLLLVYIPGTFCSTWLDLPSLGYRKHWAFPEKQYLMYATPVNSPEEAGRLILKINLYDLENGKCGHVESLLYEVNVSTPNRPITERVFPIPVPSIKKEAGK